MRGSCRCDEGWSGLRCTAPFAEDEPVRTRLYRSGSCSTDEDCNMCGRCRRSACECDTGWTGKHCELIKFGRSFDCGEGGLCLDREHGFTSTWCGSVLRADDGSYHMLASGIAGNLGLSEWLTKSRILHAVSSRNATGPFVLRDVALGEGLGWDGTTQHNGEVHRVPDGTYVLYYMGAQSQSASQLPEARSSSECPLDHSDDETVCMQRVGLATSRSLDGPWSRLDAPVVPVGTGGDWDSLFTTNPTAHLFRNGSALLVYKGRSHAQPELMRTGLAFADDWRGPYVRLSQDAIDVPTNCEDPSIYWSPRMDVYRMVLHCGCSYQVLWSRDGRAWRRTARPQPWCDVRTHSGGTLRLARRERPQWVLGADGSPTHLVNGVLPTRGHDGRTFTMITPIDK